MAELDVSLAGRIAVLALDCVHREYPNKISHVLCSKAEARAPRELTPAFYGCYDWHSAVHNHWLLARLARLLPRASFASAALAALRKSLTKDNIEGEVLYSQGEGRQSFERPYGLAWLLQLSQELHEWDDAAAHELSRELSPLEQKAKQRLADWLPKLPRPIRTGEHNQTAFALGLLIDYARAKKDPGFLAMLQERVEEFYLKDRDWPFHYEPSGEDFLSSGLAEADVVRRVLEAQAFAVWLTGFSTQSIFKLQPVASPDRSDPKFSHLDGLNLSRAWMLEGIAHGLPESDARKSELLSLAKSHTSAGLAAINSQHYVGSHWLGTFAVYLITRRGIAQ